jgi:hypothetical protein
VTSTITIADPPGSHPHHAHFPELDKVAASVAEKEAVAVVTVVAHPDPKRIGLRMVVWHTGTMGSSHADEAVLWTDRSTAQPHRRARTGQGLATRSSANATACLPKRCLTKSVRASRVETRIAQRPIAQRPPHRGLGSQGDAVLPGGRCECLVTDPSAGLSIGRVTS